MRLSLSILIDELSEYIVEKQVSEDETLNLRRPKILQYSEQNLESDCLYITNYSTLDSCTLDLTGISLLILDSSKPSSEKNAQSFYLVFKEIESLEQCFEMVYAIFEKYQNWDYTLIHLIASGKPLEEIADYAATVLHNPFAILDVSMRTMFTGGKVPDDSDNSVWKSVLNEGYSPIESYFPSSEKLYQFLNFGRKAQLNYDTPFSETNLLACLYFQKKVNALLCSTDIYAPFTFGQIQLFEYVRDQIELAMASRFQLQAEQDYTLYYIKELLKGFSVNEKIIRYHLYERNWKPTGNFCIYTIQNPDGSDFEKEQEKFCTYRIKRINPNVFLFSYENALVLITNLNNKDMYDSYNQELHALIDKLNLICGCSYIFDNFFNIKYHYIQSKAAIQLGIDLQHESNFMEFKNYYLSHMMHSIAQATSVKSLCHPMISQLYQYDEENNTNFVTTLKKYLLHGCNIATTGKSLFVHRNTLVYRLGKIEELLGVSFHELEEEQYIQLLFSCFFQEWIDSNPK